MTILFVIFIILLYVGISYWEKHSKEKEMEEFSKRRQEEEEKLKKEFEEKGYPLIQDARQVEKKDSKEYEEVKRYTNIAKEAREKYVKQGPFDIMYKRTRVLTEEERIKEIAYSIYSKNGDKSFKEKLLYYIDNKGLKDSEVYTRAEISRQVFNNIINIKGYIPRKENIFRLILALELSIEEATELLELAHDSFSIYSYEDVYVKLAIENSFYDVKKIYKEINSMKKKMSSET